ncbi:MAG: acyl-CoA dehydrogenase family protein [Actinobacteria bacterium]|nr:acyl-CoA dehydrogenase family protein [Actinomycetota bacterium]
MSPLRLTDEQEMLLGSLREFLDREVPAGMIREYDKEDRPPMELREKMKPLGVFGLTVPEEFGGAGRCVTEAVMVVEELSRVWPALAWIYIGTAFYGGENIYKLGSEEQKRAFLPGLASGDLFFAYALTEPEAGSDTLSIRTRATKEGSAYILEGTKTFISLPDHADWIIVLARTERGDDPRHGLTFFLVPRGSEGLSFNPIEKLGYKGSTLCEVVLDRVPVPEDNILGGPGCRDRGWEQLLKTLDVEHLEIAACGTGLAQGAFDLAKEYAAQRTQFGRPIVKFQAVAHMLADMATNIQASRLMVRECCSLIEEGLPAGLEACMAKYFATETAKKCALDALQIYGGLGYTMECDVQRYVRDSLVLTIGGGTSQILKNQIASLIYKSRR